MADYFYFLLPIIIEYKYLAIFLALTSAGFGVPIPEEMTIIISGYLVATGRMEFWITFMVCYGGVLSGDLVTYALGRYGGRIFLGSKFLQIFISKKRLGQAQYYYRRYGPRSLLIARQAPGIRFPAFFTAGLLKMRLVSFLKYDCAAALVSMPIAYLIAYYFGPRIQKTLSVVVNLRNIATIGAGILLVLGVSFLLIKNIKRKETAAEKLDSK